MKVELIDVSKKIRGVTILQDINMTFEAGNVYGLWGKNGCGKTMLMRVISGLIRPTTGEVRIDQQILGKEMDFPDSIGLLLETPAFLSGYTGLENLKALAEIKGLISEERIRETIQAVGLDPDDKRVYRKYSLGMKQRLGIACAIMEEPELILLDEPINAIDEKGAENVKKLILDLKKKGKLIIVACHDREDLNDLADQILFMEEGHIARCHVVKESANE